MRTVLNSWQRLPHTFRASAYTAVMLSGQWLIVPALLRRGEQRHASSWSTVGRILIGGGVAWTAWSTITLTNESAGTPFPFDPPQALVSVGPFAYTRNPMMLGVLTVILGDSLRRGSRRQLGYTAVLALIYELLVRYEEEPWLQKHFGGDWQQYADRIPRWF